MGLHENLSKNVVTFSTFISFYLYTKIKSRRYFVFVPLTIVLQWEEPLIKHITKETNGEL